MPTGTFQTRRWNDPPWPNEGVCILVTRYRPRGLAKANETWDEWDPDLGPSIDLHKAAYGKGVLAIPWETYRVLYLREMRQRKEKVAALAYRVAAGESVTLLCSSACDRASRCHRSVLKGLIEAEITRRTTEPGGDAADPRGC